MPDKSETIAQILAFPKPPEPRPPEDVQMPQPEPRIKITRLADIEPTLDTIDLVEDLLSQGSTSVIYGQSNSGKTFVALDLAMHIAMGKPWRGREVQQCGVIYCALEGTFGIRNRVAAFRREHNVPDDTPFGIVTVSLEMLQPETAEQLAAAIVAEAEAIGVPIGLIVMDTLSRALAGGDENSAEAMGRLVTHSDYLRGETRAHIMWVHHAGKDDSRGARGHSLLRAAIDTEIEVIDDDGTRTIRVRKQRDHELGRDMPFRLRVVELGANPRGKMITTCVVDHDEEEEAQAAPAGKRLTNDRARAYLVLTDLIAGSGQSGHRGVPQDIPSVPEEWWRDRFYERAKPGATQEIKRQAFTRAADYLINERMVGMANKRVWIVARRE